MHSRWVRHHCYLVLLSFKGSPTPHLKTEGICWWPKVAKWLCSNILRNNDHKNILDHCNWSPEVKKGRRREASASRTSLAGSQIGQVGCPCTQIAELAWPIPKPARPVSLCLVCCGWPLRPDKTCLAGLRPSQPGIRVWVWTDYFPNWFLDVFWHRNM